MNVNPVFVEVLRGGIVESMHRGAMAIIDVRGVVHTAMGDIDRPIFPRSAIKVLQALPLVASGAADKLSLTDEELALTCASHGGEERHVQTALSMLTKAGLSEAALECGTQWPSHDGSTKSLARAGRHPSALNNNCSGKHAGFLCLGCLMADGKDVADFVTGYVKPDHPVMQAVRTALQATTGFDLSRTAQGIDGCSIPTFAIPLRHLAHAFARIATGVGLSTEHAQASKRLRQAVANAPYMVAGTGRMDTLMMERLGQRLFCKVGAEGVYCAALPELGLGVALKMDDGNNARSCEVTMAAIVEALLPLSTEDAAFVRGFSDAPIRNWNAIEVGRLQATSLLRAIRA